jgi:hypothetical protein
MVLAIANKPAMNTHMQDSCEHKFSFLVEKLPIIHLLLWRGGSCLFNFLFNSQSILVELLFLYECFPKFNILKYNHQYDSINKWELSDVIKSHRQNPHECIFIYRKGTKKLFTLFPWEDIATWQHLENRFCARHKIYKLDYKL